MPDLDALQGTWLVTALEIDGMTVGAIPPGASITVSGARFTTAGMGAEYEGDLELDGASQPKQFDLRFTTGPEKGNTALGIYELSGDSWKMCLTTHGGQRPVNFSTKSGTGHALQTLVRAKSVRPAELDGDPAPELDGEWLAESLVMDGQPLPKSMAKTCKRIAKDGELKVFMGPQTIVHVKFAVDRAQQPMAINYVHLSGGQSQSGIYKLEKNVLTTCLAKQGGPRPDAFASVPGDGRTLTVWKKRG